MSTVDPVVSNAAPVPFVPAAASAVALERCKAELEEATKGPLEPLNVDIASSVRVMLTACGNAAPYRAELVKLGQDVLPTLETRAQALSYAHALHQWTLETPSAVETLAADVMEARRVLVSALELVQLRGILANTAIKLQGTTSYVATALDVRAISSAFIASWDQVGKQIGGDIQAVNDAMVLADQLISAVAQAAGIREKLKGAALTRLAAWTLAVNSYRELQRGIGYIRFHNDDAEQIVPSLFDKTKPRKKVAEGEKPVEDLGALVPPARLNGTGSGSPSSPSAPIMPSKPLE